MNPTKEQIEQLYRNGVTQTEIAIGYGVSQSRISYLMRNYGIKADYKYKSWTDEEIEYLETYYGIHSLQTIGKKLGRTPQAVETKARKIGLSCLLNTGKLTAAELARAFKVDIHVITYNWIKKKGLKASFKIIKSSRKFWRIDTEKFWEWAYKNRKIINFAKLDKNALGAEPAWVEIERRKDFKETPKRLHCKWTEEEDKKLAMLWSNTNYTAEKIGKLLGKTAGGISRRRRRLDLQPRKIPIKWKIEEVEIIINMKSKGALDKEIAYELGREESEVSWKRKELIKQGKLNWRYREKVVEG